MSEYKNVWVHCDVSEGLFSNELSVEITLPGGQKISFYADKRLVQNRAGRDYVLATLIGGNGTENNKTVVLPSEPFETGSSWISVPEQELAPA
jgi:hypothetical protein